LSLYSGKPLKNDSLVKKSGIISANNLQYQVIGIDPAKNLLVLNKISQEIRSINQAGFQAPSIVGKDISTAQSINLKDYKGKYVYLDFWGSWCAPCIEQIPELKRIYNLTSREKLIFIGIAVKETGKNKVKAEIRKNKIKWANLISDTKNPIAEQYGINRYPTNILIDPNGKILYNNMNIYEIQNVLLKLRLLK
jgi:thiol-disulfide isomerase/thioredoxin